MANESEMTIGLTAASKRISGLRRFSKIFFQRPLVVLGLGIIVAAVFVAVFAPFVAPYDPYSQDLNQTLLPPSWEHPLGTDGVGRDTLSRTLFGTRTSLIVGLGAVAIGTLVGYTMGLVAGYFGGTTYAVIMRITDTLMAFPNILLALTIAGLLGGGINNIVVALGVALVPSFARFMCGQVLSARENDYIVSARSIGSSNLRIMLCHVVPNCFPPLIVQMTLWMGHAILSEAGLSFLGIGIEPPGAAWGAMVSDGYQHLLSRPMLSFGPGFAIMLVVFAFNMVGDGLRDALDPRLRGMI
jgi:peptide/nickel transport system permease protein